MLYRVSYQGAPILSYSNQWYMSILFIITRCDHVTKHILKSQFIMKPKCWHVNQIPIGPAYPTRNKDSKVEGHKQKETETLKHREGLQKL